MDTLFKEPLNLFKTKKLLQFVSKSDYTKATQIAGTDPELMFNPIQYTYPDGEIESISPLQYAFKFYDTCMWRMFFQKIENHPAYVARFLQQARDQQNYLDLTPLFAAYATYLTQYARSLTKDITKEELKKAWLAIGTKQAELLAFRAQHLLKAFCNDFHAMEAPTIPYVFIPPEYYVRVPLCLPLIHSLGRDYTLLRGSSELSRVGLIKRGDYCFDREPPETAMLFMTAYVEYDKGVLQDLYKTKVAELEDHLRLLELQVLENKRRMTV